VGFVTKKMAQALVLLATVGVLAGCSAIRPEHCPYADWNATGELHASKGYQSRLPSLFDTCLGVGVLPDADAYVAGYQRGLREFCTIENGWVWGQTRTSNPSTCPPALASGFDRSFSTSARLSALAVEESNLRARRDELEDLLLSGAPVDPKLLRELRDIRTQLDRVQSERQRTRNGFANWLGNMGLEAPSELYSY